jgi:hypothetical protein
MGAKGTARPTGIGGVALGMALAALAIGAPGAGAETPTWERFEGEGAGRRDVAAEVAWAADEARLGWGAETPTWDRFQGEGAGRPDVVVEVARAADEARLGWGAEAFAATLAGEEWASTRQYPGRPH